MPWFTRTIWLISFCIATFPILGWAEESLNGEVLKVVDGDTITIITNAQQTKKIRLSEIDTPERDQPWGRQASRALSKKVANKSIVAKVSGVDRYDRVIAEIFVGERNINHEMVSEGHAWAYCSGLMERDTFMRDNIVNHKGVNYDAKTQLQAVPERV